MAVIETDEYVAYSRGSGLSLDDIYVEFKRNQGGQEVTTPVRLSVNLFWSTSCWYCPTPIAFGSIFTNSARGSCNLLAIEIAPLKDTLISEYSSVASFDAE